MKRQFIASGEGIVSMLDFCCRNGLTRENSTLEREGDKWSVVYTIDEDTGEYVKIENEINEI